MQAEVGATAEGLSYRKKSQPIPESISARTHPLREYTRLAPVSSEEHLHWRALVRKGTCSLISLNAHLAYTWGTLWLSLSTVLTEHLWDSLLSPSPSFSTEHLRDFSFLPPSLDTGTFIDFQNTFQMTKPRSHRDITSTQCTARGLMEAHSALWQTDYLSRGLSADRLQGIQNKKRKVKKDRATDRVKVLSLSNAPSDKHWLYLRFEFPYLLKITDLICWEKQYPL